MLLRVFQVTLALIGLVAAQPVDAGVRPFRVNPIFPIAVTAFARLVPNSTWTGGYNTSGGTAPVTGTVQATNVPNSQNTGGGNGIAYGAQAITAVAVDSALNVPQLTVASTANMSEGEYWRVDGTGLLGVDQQSRLHIVDATHVDLCDDMDFSGSGTGQCKILSGERPTPVTTGYSGSGGMLWFDQTAVGTFAEHPNVWCEAGGCNITVGAASNTDAWIDHVDFCFEVCASGSMVTVTQQTKNPLGNFFGWTANIQSRGALDPNGPKDGLANLYAVITPVNGFQRVIGPLPIVLNGNGTIQHPTFYVSGGASGTGSDTSCDGKSYASASAPDSSGHCAWATVTKAMCSMYTSASGSSTSMGPVVHVAGAPITTSSDGTNPTAGLMYQETTSASCGGANLLVSQYPARFIADSPVYLTTSSTPSAWSGSFTSWTLPVYMSSWEGPFAFDTEFTTPVIGSSSNPTGGMLWFGAGSKWVAASGPANTAYGSTGPALMYYPNNPGKAPQSYDGLTASNFVGGGEMAISSVTAGPGPRLMRDADIKLNVDCMQTKSGPFAFFNVTCNHTIANVGTTSASYVTVKDVVCTTNYLNNANQTTPVIQIDTNESPWPNGTSGYGPFYGFALTGNGGNSSSVTAPNWELGASSTFATNMCISNCTTQTAAPGATYVWLKPPGNGGFTCVPGTNGANATSSETLANGQPIINFQAGDKIILGGEEHPDYLQIGTNNENMFLENYTGLGQDQQASLFQQNSPALTSSASVGIATQGRSFTLVPGGAVNIGDEISIPYGYNSPARARRVVALGPQTYATWTGSWGYDKTNDGSDYNLTINALRTGTPQAGMEIFVNSNSDCSGTFYDYNLVITGVNSGTTMGQPGSYTMNNKRDQQTQNMCMQGVLSSGGTLDGPFPVDIASSSPAYNFTTGPQLKDFACVNCLFADTLGITGILAQWQGSQRHVFFENWTITSMQGDPSPGGYPFHTSIVNSKGGFRNEASGINNAIMPYAFLNDASNNIGSDLISMRNVQYTDYNSYHIITSGTTYVPGTSFDPVSHLPSNAKQLLKIGPKSAAKVPWDVNGYLRAAGQPVGAVVH